MNKIKSRIFVNILCMFLTCGFLGSVFIACGDGDKDPEDQETTESNNSDEQTLEEILETLDPLVSHPIDLNDQETDDLMAFLHALTDLQAAAMTSQIPSWVPNGLPADD